MRLRRSLLPALAVALAASPPAAGDPAGRTTLDESIALRLENQQRVPVRAAGLPRQLHVAGNFAADPTRTARRRSLAFFAQLSDAQLADEASPARLELARPGGPPGLWRPHEALTAHTFDQAVRNVNANLQSPVPDGRGRRARLGLALYTGDLSDNHQYNEIRWAVRILDGGRVDPFSGRRVGPGNRCPGASPAVVRRLNAAVAGRRYTGVQDRADYPGRPAATYAQFYDPDVSEPRFPGLLERAQRPFVARGLRVPWYSARGNHDGLAQGFFAARDGARTATGCRKVFPSSRMLPALANPWDAMLRRLRRGAFERVPPDPRRRLVGVRTLKRLHGHADNAHGFGLVARAELRASRGAASYYSFAPRPGLRFVAIDTVAEGGDSDGNLDHPQYRWLARTLRAAQGRDELVVLYGHHSLETMRNPLPDERARRCGPGRLACDADPRRSTPLHLGDRGPANLRALLLQHRNVVLFVTGHLHRHRAAAHLRATGNGGFWQLTTASHTSFPQQTRLIDLMDNNDGTVSIHATALDTAAPITAPTTGTAGETLTHPQLGSISRLLAANVAGDLLIPAGPAAEPAAATAPNLELVIPDPRAQPSGPPSSASKRSEER